MVNKKISPLNCGFLIKILRGGSWITWGNGPAQSLAYRGLMDEFKQKELHKAKRVAGTSQESQALRTLSEEDNADCLSSFLTNPKVWGILFLSYLSFPK